MPAPEKASDHAIHPTAIIDDPATPIGAGTRIWHWVHVMPGAIIGDRCSIGQGCFIGRVRIGDGCRIQNHVSLYDGVILDEDVFVGPSAVFTNVKHPRAHVSRRDDYDQTHVGQGATIGANATVLCGVSIGAYAMIGAGAAVTHDVPAYAVMVGTPARRVAWACRCGETLPDTRACQRCGDHYDTNGATLTLTLVA